MRVNPFLKWEETKKLFLGSRAKRKKLNSPQEVEITIIVCWSKIEEIKYKATSIKRFRS